MILHHCEKEPNVTSKYDLASNMCYDEIKSMIVMFDFGVRVDGLMH